MLDKILGPFCRRFGWFRTALAVQMRFGELKGAYLAGALTLNLFLSLIPLLLVTVAVIGLFTSRDTSIPAQIVGTFGLTGDAADNVVEALGTASESAKAASIVGLLGALWSGLGVAASLQYVIDSVWQVSGAGLKDRIRGLVWSAGALLLIGLSISMAAAVDYFAPGFAIGVLTVVLSIIVNFGLWMWTFDFLSHRKLPWRAYVPGAVLAALGLEAIKGLATLIPNLVSGSGAIYGTIGVAISVLTSLFLLGRVLTYANVLNVIRWEEDNGTATVDIEVPKVPGVVATEADRAGTVSQ